MMRDYLCQAGIGYSYQTIHKYMSEFGLRLIVKRIKPCYIQGTRHEIFKNLLHQDFSRNKMNRVWCIDFTYFPQPHGAMRYQCTIIDLYDRHVVETLNSNPGSQFASYDFRRYSQENHIQQSMNRVVCPYDNVPMD